MNRSIRTLVVVLIAVGVAGAATFLVYQTIQSQPARVVEVASAYTVVAARPLPLGTRLQAADLKLVPWPAANPLSGGFTKVEDAVDRGLIAAVAENEPLTGNNVAAKEAGAGLPPTIPPGMRAMSVKVNEVIGVAGFVAPGTRVDVMAILTQAGQKVARVVVSNVQVLAAGTRTDQEAAREGKAIPGTSVVTLLVTPADAEVISLAGSEGSLMLTLRNPMDNATATSTGTGTASFGGNPPPPNPAPAPRRAAAAPVAAPAPPPPAPTPTPKPPVVVIKAGVSKEIIK
jgi:pilus assembly protein CpaB